MTASVLAVIFAGGQGRRLGGDKALVRLGGRPLLSHVAGRLEPQVSRIVVNANGDPSRFPGFSVVADRPGGKLDGPFLGLATAIACFAADHVASHLLTVPTDVPFLPENLVARFLNRTDNTGYAATAEGPHPVIALWTRDGIKRAEARLRDYTGERLDRFIESCGGHAVLFPDAAAFLNINTPADLAAAESRLVRI